MPRNNLGIATLPEKAKVSADTLTPKANQAIYADNYNTESAILEGLKSKYHDAPDDLLEWMAADLGASAIAPEIALKNFTPVWDKKAIAKILEWKGYFDELGWVSGNLALLERQFKPKKPHTFEDRSTSKYLTCKKGYDAALLKGVDWDAIANDPTEPIVITEGAKKAASLIGRGYKAISLPGVDMGHPKGKRGVELVPGLDRLAVLGRPFILAFDSDITEKAEVQGALINLAATLKKKHCVLTIWTWPASAGKGIDDAIVNGNFNQVSEITYKEFAKKLEKQFSSGATQTGNNNATKKQDTQWADEIAEAHQNQLAWDDTTEQWRQYGAKYQGVWSVISAIQICRIIKKYIQSQGKECGASKLSAIEKILRMNLLVDDWSDNPELIAFEDGVYHQAIKTLKPHSPDYRLTSRLPYCYNSESDSFARINDWVSFAVGGDQNYKDLLIAYLVAIITKRSDLQKFLMLQGKGGSGKGTFIRLACDLVGKDNVHSSTLAQWNGNKFEPANGYRKQLITFSDEQNKHKDLGNFFKLTGQDYIRAEEKGKKAFQYQFNGMTILACNKPIFVSTSKSALHRRQIIVPFNAEVPSSQCRDLNAEFQQELPALARFLLNINRDWVTKILKGQDNQGVTQEVWANLIRTEGLAAWFNDCVICDSGEPTPVGSRKFSDPNKAPDECTTLFESYTLYCHQNNYQQGYSKNNFSSELIELCRSVVKLGLGKHSGKNHNTIQCPEQGLGLRLRYSKLDAHIPTIEYKLESQKNKNQSLVETWWRPGGDLVETSVETSVEAETIAEQKVQQTVRDRGDQNATFSYKNISELKTTQDVPQANHTQIASQSSTKGEPEHNDDHLTESIRDTHEQERKLLAAKSTELIKKLKSSCYPSMSDDEYRDRFRNLLRDRYGVPIRSQMTLKQLQNFIDFLRFWSVQGAKFKPPAWRLPTEVNQVE